MLTLTDPLTFLPAADPNTNATIIYCHAPFRRMAHRVKKRAEDGGDPSEATVAVLNKQTTEFQHPANNELEHVIDLNTSKTDWMTRIDVALRRDGSAQP